MRDQVLYIAGGMAGILAVTSGFSVTFLFGLIFFIGLGFYDRD